MSHHHHHHAVSGKKMFYTILLNSLITLAEVIGGLLSGSLALLSDAMHNLNDTVSIVISYFANKISQRQQTESHTFGYKRAEILAALFNASVLFIIAFFLFKEAYHRFIEPTEIRTELLMIIATIGLLGNLISVFLLHDDSHKNLNVKAAYLHLMADTLSSVAVILGGVVIHFWGWHQLDSILTVVIGLYILKESVGIISQAVSILMQQAPKDVPINAIQHTIEALDEVHNLHHVHLWQLNDRETFFEAHVELAENCSICDSTKVLTKIENLLKETFHIYHTTLQMEYQKCSDPQTICTSQHDHADCKHHHHEHVHA